MFGMCAVNAPRVRMLRVSAERLRADSSRTGMYVLHRYRRVCIRGGEEEEEEKEKEEG